MGNPLKRKQFRKVYGVQTKKDEQTVTSEKIEVKPEKKVEEKIVEDVKQEVVETVADIKEEDKIVKKENKKK